MRARPAAARQLAAAVLRPQPHGARPDPSGGARPTPRRTGPSGTAWSGRWSSTSSTATARRSPTGPTRSATRPDLNIFWNGTDNEFLAFYDYTANALFKPFEERGIDMRPGPVGGPEAGGSADPTGYITHLLYHASPTAVEPGGGLRRAQPRLPRPGLRRAALERVAGALRRARGPFGTPLDLVSVHAYKRAADAPRPLIGAPQPPLSIDGPYFERLGQQPRDDAGLDARRAIPARPRDVPLGRVLLELGGRRLPAPARRGGGRPAQARGRGHADGLALQPNFAARHDRRPAADRRRRRRDAGPGRRGPGPVLPLGAPRRAMSHELAPLRRRGRRRAALRAGARWSRTPT